MVKASKLGHVFIGVGNANQVTGDQKVVLFNYVPQPNMDSGNLLRSSLKSFGNSCINLFDFDYFVIKSLCTFTALI